MTVATQDLKRMSIDMPRELHELIKEAASFEHKSIKAFVLEAVKEQLATNVQAQRQSLREKYRKLNALTAKTFEKTDRGEELHHYNSFEDFLAEEREETNA